MIIGLHGKLQSGKDTVGKFLIEKYGFKRLAFADALKNALYALNPKVDIRFEVAGSRDRPKPEEGSDTQSWTDTTTTKLEHVRLQKIVDKDGWEKAKITYPEIRRLLQRLGTEAGREIHGYDCWTNIVKRQIEENPEQNYVITDLRFPNEKELVESLGGYVVHIIRDGQQSNDTHASEQVLEGIPYKIENNGSLADLDTGINTMYKYLTIEREGEVPMTVSCYTPCIEKSIDNA